MEELGWARLCSMKELGWARLCSMGRSGVGLAARYIVLLSYVVGVELSVFVF